MRRTKDAPADAATPAIAAAVRSVLASTRRIYPMIRRTRRSFKIGCRSRRTPLRVPRRARQTRARPSPTRLCVLGSPLPARRWRGRAFRYAPFSTGGTTFTIVFSSVVGPRPAARRRPVARGRRAREPRRQSPEAARRLPGASELDVGEFEHAQARAPGGGIALPRTLSASSDVTARSTSNAPPITAPAPQPTRTPTGPPRTPRASR
jgi:hypothetical protein